MLISNIPPIVDFATTQLNSAFISSNKTLYRCGLNEVRVILLIHHRMEHLELVPLENILKFQQEFTIMFILLHHLEKPHSPKFNVL
jgi:hypothetical protein